MVSKQLLLEKLIKVLEQDLVATKAAAESNRDAATNEESKPENEYDTRALEAGYLASAQAKRAGEIEESLFLLRECHLRDFSATDSIDSTALIQVISEGKRQWLFLLPAGAGTLLNGDESLRVQVVTAKSPLGEALMGLQVGDIATIDRGSRSLDFEVLEVL